MDNLSVLIVDDEPLAHEVIMQHLNSVPELKLVGHCYSAQEAQQFLSRQDVDVLFLDINMPEISGLEFLKSITKKPLTIITSAYRQYALEGFELDVVDYLLKPFGLPRFKQAVNKVLALNNVSKAESTDAELVYIRVDQKQLPIKLGEILYLEAYGNYVKVVLEQKTYLTANTLSALEKEFSHLCSHYLRIHKSFVINTKQIVAVGNNEVTLKGEYLIPIGKTYKKMVKEKFS